MDEVWERAVETALDGQTDCSSTRALTLDGAVKCIQGRLPSPELLERFQSLEHLSIANVGVSSLEKFPRLPNLQRLILSDNRIAGGLEFLVEAGLASLRDLDLSNNRIQFVEDLAPLAQLRLLSLDLYECPVTRVKDYRARVFALIRSLKYLDKMDADENERPESDEDEDEEDEDDPGSGEVDGEDRLGKSANAGVSGGIVDVDEDEESDADEEESETVRVANGLDRTVPSHHQLSNGFRVAAAAAGRVSGDEDEEDVEDEDDDDLGEEIDEDEGEDDDVVEVHEIVDSEDEDGVEEDDEDDDDEEEEEYVEDEEEDAEPGSTGRLTSTEGEIDGHEQGEEDENGEIGEEDEHGVEEHGEYEEDEDDDDENGEIGEEEQAVEEDGEYEDDDDGEDEEEDFGSEYLVQPVGQAEEEAGGSDLDPGNEEDGEEEEVENEESHHKSQASSSQPKRKRIDGNGIVNDDDSIEDTRPSKGSKHL